MFQKKAICMLLTTSLLAACSNDNNDAVESSKVIEQKQEVTTEQAETITQLAEKSQVSVNHVYDQATTVLFKARALQASMFGVTEEVAGGYYADQLEDYSPAAETGLREKLRDHYKNLLTMHADTEAGEETRKVMANLARYYAGEPNFDVGYIDVWMGHTPFIVSQISGPVIDVPNLLQNNHPLKTEQDVKDYLARMAKFDRFVGSVNKKVLSDAEQGWIPPKVIINGALSFLQGFVQAEPNQHALVTNLQAKIANIHGIDSEQKAAYISQAEKSLETVVYPAYQELAKTMASLLDKATDESGIWAQPNGDAFYQDAVRQLGDTDLSPQEIHQIGLDEVERISKEMDAILRAEGYKEGSVGARMASLNDEERFIYEDSDQGRQQLLDDLNGMLADINKVMPSQFATIPPYDVEIRRIPVERQEGAPGGQYTPPTLDGSAPGIYWINLRDMESNPKFDLKTLTYHEANPGHHWQIALNMAQEDLPLMRRIAPYNAYVEGWALYSERVASEMGMYKDDPFGDLGRLKAELFRAVRLVVDTGLHAKKWSREQAIDYMAEKTGSAKSGVVSEIERYMAWPGQALGYKLGMLNILSQREKAKQALGDKFDIKAFHDLVLLGGAVPMSVLNEKITRWVETQR
ncbi:MAG: DUF885 domain-containing protein [Kangiellaceae bacterium]|nr:DUF885 domain-containing protein [Kangiellaceae bacterium]